MWKVLVHKVSESLTLVMFEVMRHLTNDGVFETAGMAVHHGRAARGAIVRPEALLNRSPLFLHLESAEHALTVPVAIDRRRDWRRSRTRVMLT